MLEGEGDPEKVIIWGVGTLPFSPLTMPVNTVSERVVVVQWGRMFSTCKLEYGYEVPRI